MKYKQWIPSYRSYRKIMLLPLLLYAVISHSQAVNGTVSKILIEDSSKLGMPFNLTDEQRSNNSKRLRFSALTGYRHGMNPTINLGNFERVDDKTTGTTRLYAYNLSIADMLSHGIYYAKDDIVLEVNDPKHYMYDILQGDTLDWLRKNAYSFEQVLPYGKTSFQLLTDEMARLLNVTYRKEKRLVKSLVLFRISEEEKFKYVEGPRIMNSKTGQFNRIPFHDVAVIISSSGPRRVLDETGYKGQVAISLDVKSWYDIDSIRNSLKRYGLDLKEEEREREVFIISEPGFKRNLK